jgi:endonuclease/exonuclease/phosphatase family metal-dependent hydrolase
MARVTVATYNVHKCKGMDRQVDPGRIADVLREVDADVVALQEVLSIEDGVPEDNQARFIAESLGYAYEMGQNRELNGGRYGNVVVSRLPMRTVCNHDITVRGRERRGCLHIDVDLGDSLLHIFNVHLGTSFLERRHQGRRLVDDQILANRQLRGARIMLGDFNEWTSGLASELLAAHLKSVDIKTHLQRRYTFPGRFPFMHLDHIYFDDRLELLGLRLHRTKTALVASDHLPLVADFLVPPGIGREADQGAEAPQAANAR